MALKKSGNKIIILKEDIDRLELPDGYVLKKVETKEERINREIQKLEAELVKISIPMDKELIEEGKTIHPYYLTLEQIEMYKKRIE